MEIRAKGDANAVAAMAGDDGSGPVGWQINLIGQIAERGGPVRELLGNRAVGIALAAKRIVLPERVVGILHWQSRELGRSASAARRIGARQIARQRAPGPAIAGDVVEQQQQHVLAGLKRKQMGPQRRLSGEIEPVSRRRVESLGKGHLADRHDLQSRPCRRSFEDQLSWHTQCIGEDSAQALVALHHIAERCRERGVVEFACETQGDRDRVGRARPFQPIKEPQPALRERERKLGRSRHHHQRRPRSRGLT